MFFVLISSSDAISPLIVGAISDFTSNLDLALSVIPISIGLGGFVFLFGWRVLDESKLVDESSSYGILKVQILPLSSRFSSRIVRIH